MNITLWILQGLLAFWNLTGGLYTIFNYEALKSEWASHLPKPLWIAIGVLQVLFSVGLVIPKFTSKAAIYLSINSLLGCVVFSKYAGFPGMLWGLVPALLTAFVAYGRINE